MFNRIVINPEIMLGQPVIKDTRMPVYLIVESIAAGESIETILKAYPFLTGEDIQQALQFAARLSQYGLEVA